MNATGNVIPFPRPVRPVPRKWDRHVDLNDLLCDGVPGAWLGLDADTPEYMEILDETGRKVWEIRRVA